MIVKRVPLDVQDSSLVSTHPGVPGVYPACLRGQRDSRQQTLTGASVGVSVKAPKGKNTSVLYTHDGGAAPRRIRPQHTPLPQRRSRD